MVVMDASQVSRTVARLGSEISGVPVNQVLGLIPEAAHRPSAPVLQFRELASRIGKVEAEYRRLLKEDPAKAARYRDEHMAEFRSAAMVKAASTQMGEWTRRQRDARGHLKTTLANAIDTRAERVLKSYETEKKKEKR